MGEWARTQADHDAVVSAWRHFYARRWEDGYEGISFINSALEATKNAGRATGEALLADVCSKMSRSLGSSWVSVVLEKIVDFAAESSLSLPHHVLSELLEKSLSRLREVSDNFCFQEASLKTALMCQKAGLNVPRAAWIEIMDTMLENVRQSNDRPDVTRFLDMAATCAQRAGLNLAEERRDALVEIGRSWLAPSRYLRHPQNGSTLDLIDPINVALRLAGLVGWAPLSDAGDALLCKLAMVEDREFVERCILEHRSRRPG